MLYWSEGDIDSVLFLMEVRYVLGIKQNSFQIGGHHQHI